MKQILTEWRNFLQEEEDGSSIQAILDELKNSQTDSPTQALTASPAFAAWSMETFADVVKNPYDASAEAFLGELTRSRVNPTTGKRIEFDILDELKLYKEHIEQEVFDIWRDDGERVMNQAWFEKWQEDPGFGKAENFVMYFRRVVMEPFHDELYNKKFPELYDKLFERSPEWKQKIVEAHGELVKFKLRKGMTTTSIMLGRFFGPFIMDSLKSFIKSLYLAVVWAAENYDGLGSRLGRLLVSDDHKNVVLGLETFASMQGWEA